MMKCEIIRDLIPLYLDDVCSEESKKLVEDHLSECKECRKYERITDGTGGEKTKTRRRPG